MDVHTQQWVDFGSNCYAAQSFQHEDRRILIGWISDFYGEHIATEPGAYGSMTLPRELHVKNELPGNEKVEEGDELVCYGRYRDFQTFWKAI